MSNQPLRFMTACCLTVAILLLSTSVSYAQFDTAAVLGSVRDSTGAIVPKATVTLTNVATGIKQTVQTDAEGNYQFNNVKIGLYQLTAEAQGFARAVAENVQLAVNARQRVDLVLKAGAVTETVNVSADAVQLLETESSDRGQVINRQQIVNLPLNGRSYADLALLAPGVRRSILSAQESGTRDASFNVNGLRSSLNNFVLDGVDNNFYGTSNQGFSNQVVQASPDALQEFKVQTNNFSAEYGRAGGAIINASLRSGTNEFHGSVYDFLRNTSLNAVGFFKPTRGIKPVLIQNQFGGTIGGPIIKDRTFFFLDYEGFRRITRSLQITTIPSLAERQGILGVAVRIPYDFTDSNGTLQKAGTVINAGSPVPLTAFAKKVLADLPSPTTAAATNNFENLPRNKFYNDKGDLKIDHNFNQKTTAFVRLSQRKLNNFEAPVIPGPLFSGANAFIRVLNQQLASGVTHNLSANSLVEFRLGISRTLAGKQPTGLGGPNMQTLYGITGLPTDPSIAGGLNTQSISGYQSLGRQNSNPQHQDPTVVNPRVNYTFLLGRHSLKTGYEYQHINTVIEDFHPKYGEDIYSGQFSRPSGAASDNRYNLADFFFGARNTYNLNNTALLNYRQRMHFAYAQDDFKFNPKLTLNLGMRYEFATPQYEADNHLANFDPTTRTLIQAKDGSLFERSGVHPDRNNWAPRVGVAYQLTPRTAIRSGYGISYIHFNRLGGENILGYNGPFIVGASVSQQTSQALCTGDNFLNCFRPTQAGYPTGLVTPANFNPLTARVNFTPNDIRTGYVQSWHLTVQRELMKNLLLDVAYVGNHSVKLVTLGDYNQARPNDATDPAAGTPLQNRRPIPGYSFIQISFPGGQANYHALQVKLERRFSQGLYLLNSFTWSKAIDNVAGHLEANFGDNSRVNIKDIRSDRGVANYNQPFNNTTSVVYDLPFGKGRRFASGINDYADAVIGGWRLTLINTAASGLPVNLTYSPASAFQVGSSLTYRPNLTGQPLILNPDEPTSYLNPAAVAIPTDRSRPFGNAGRNIVSGPSFFQTDLGLHKSFPVWREKTKLEFRMEAFNLFNHTNFVAPDSNASNIRFDANGNYTGSFGKITQSFPARQIQFALKLYF
ncbi:MAG TPA: TonB-dependent receptor [Blastocatellia bacterium]|nr:TonB-dependent receptor [Blastocatellia bacterium]